MVEKKRPHVSPSQLGTFSKCGEQYRRRYINREIIPPGIALIRGTAVHVSAEENFQQKMTTHEDLPVEKFKASAAAAFDGRRQGEGYSLTKEEESVGADKVLGKAKDQAVVMAEAVALKVAPRHQPVMVEEEQRISLPNQTHDLVVKMDLVNDRDEIPDLKTGKPKSVQDLIGSAEMRLYALAFHAKTGRPAKRILYENVSDKGAHVSSEMDLPRNPVEEFYPPAVNHVNFMLASIKAGLFKPAPSGAWWCSLRFCGYAATCPYFLSGTSGVADKEGGL